MSRLMPSSLFSTLFPDIRDPDRKYAHLCRFCGKSTEGSMRRFYCSEECFTFCQKAVSWRWARLDAYVLHGRRCVECGRKLKLGAHKWEKIDGEWIIQDSKIQVAESHHIMPVAEINALVGHLVSHEWSYLSKEEQDYAFAVLYTLLFNDVNNLKTLCPHCHKMEHGGWDKYKPNAIDWIKFWEWADRGLYTRKMTDYF